MATGTPGPTGVPHDPLFHRAHPGEDYCLDIFHHLSLVQVTHILGRIKSLFAGPHGTLFNDKEKARSMEEALQA